MIKAVIFDYDGVIIDSFKNVFKVYRKICKHFDVSCPRTINKFRKTYGYNYIECLQNLKIKEKDFAEANEIYIEEMIKKSSGVFTGIKRVIKNLYKDYDLYLVSASSSKEVLSKLEKNNLLKYFKQIDCAADVGGRKSFFIEKILKNNNYNAFEIVSIGDRVIDYDIAKRIGVPDNNIIITSYGWGFDKNKIGNANVAKKAKDIIKLIKQHA